MSETFKTNLHTNKDDLANTLMKMDLPPNAINNHNNNITQINNNKSIEEKYILNGISENLQDYKLQNFLEKKVSGKFEISTLQSIQKIEHNKEGLKELYNNLNGIIKYSLNEVNKNFPNVLESKISKIATTIFISWVQRAGATVVHEVAHTNKANYYGADTELGYGFNTENEIIGVSVYDLFISQLFYKGRAFSSHKGNFSNLEDTAISGAGININTKIAQDHIDNAIYNNDSKLDIVDSTSYILNKAYLLNYLRIVKEEGDDPLDVLEGINTQFGTEYNLDDIKKYSILSLLSGGVLTSLKEGYDFIINDKYENQILGFETPFGKVFLPEFQTYLNSNNVSFQISDHIRLKSGDILKLGFEKNIIGEKSTEFTLGGKYNFNEDLSVIGESTIGKKGSYHEARVEYQNDKNLGIFIEGKYNKGKTNVGERNTNGSDYIGLGFKYEF